MNLKEAQRESLTGEIKKERKKLMSSLLIDCILRLADYSKFYQDVPNARENFQKVIDLCKKNSGKECPHCHHYNGVLKKSTGLPL